MLETTGKTDTGQRVEDFDAPDISTQEYAEHTANQMAAAFQATNLFQIIEVKAGVGQVYLLGRVKHEDEKRFVEDVVDAALGAMEEERGCEGHVCKQYMKHHGVTKYAWNITFAARDVQSAARAISDAIDPFIPRKEVAKMPMQGPATPVNSGAGSKGRGASLVRG
jgi:hypothetical protein